MKSVDILTDVYIRLLMLDDNKIRTRLQLTLRDLRDQISTLSGKSDQEIQERCEQIAILRKYVHS